MDDCKSSQFHEYEEREKVNSMLNEFMHYIYLYLKAGKKIFLKIMGGVLKRHKSSIWGRGG